MAGAEGDEGFQSYFCATSGGGIVGETETLGEDGDDDGEFHHGEGLADAFSGAAAERKVSVRREAVGEAVEPAFRTKFIGIIEVAGIAVQNPLGHQKCGTAREKVAAERDCLVASALNDVSGGIEAESFAKDGVEIRKLTNLI